MPEPLRQIAFAKDPFLNLDGIYARVCPVKFRYFHTATKPSPAFELMQTSDGKLHGRVAMGGEFAGSREVTTGDKISLPGNFEVALVQYLPHGLSHIDQSEDFLLVGLDQESEWIFDQL